MKTLIELFDERPVENVLATEVFRPERTIFLCGAEDAQNRSKQEKLRSFMARRGLDTELIFVESSLFYTDKIKKQLLRLLEQYPDCTLDTTGGTDAALFAAGAISAEKGLPCFTFSRKRNSFYNIQGAEYAHEKPCDIRYSVEDFFLMAGGAMRQGRVDNSVLSRYEESIDGFFAIFLRYRKEWNRLITWFQRISQNKKDEAVSLYVNGPYTVKGSYGSRIKANPAFLRELEKLGYIRSLKLEGEERVSFRFKDEWTRGFLRDVGSVLELYTYQQAKNTGLFQDLVSSAVVDWDSGDINKQVSNEIDLVATRGIMPLFVSCKVCDVSTEALNELAILRDRFGGSMARAAIVTAEKCRAVTRNRAGELGIHVIDLDDLAKKRLGERLKAVAEAE